MFKSWLEAAAVSPASLSWVPSCVFAGALPRPCLRRKRSMRPSVSMNLLAGEERVALAADVNHVVTARRVSFDDVATYATHLGELVFWMNPVFGHLLMPLFSDETCPDWPGPRRVNSL